MWWYDYTQGMAVIFLMIVINSLIKTANKREAIFAIFYMKVRYRTGLCSFRMTSFYSLKNDSEARGNLMQVAQHLPVSDPQR
jgi:hypothetical protein